VSRRLVAVVGLGALWLATLAMLRSRRAQAIPESVVQRLFEAARRGDTQQYLSCFAGALRRKLDSTASEVGRAQFGQNLRARYAGLTGLAVTRIASNTPDSAPVSASGITLRIETVYRERNEVQDYRLKRSFSGWRIVRISPGQSVTMPIKYGTPVVPPPKSRSAAPDRTSGEAVSKHRLGQGPAATF